MNHLLDTLSLSPANRWLVDFSIQSTLVLALALLAVVLLRRQSAARRHLLLLAAAVSLPLLLGSSILAPRWRPFHASEMHAPLSVAPVIEVDFERSLVVGTAVGDGGAIGGAPPPSSQDFEPHSRSLPLTWIWLAGVGLLIARLAAGAFALRRIDGGECAASLEEQLSIEARAMGVSRRPALLCLGEGTMPMTWGLRQHVVALPSGAGEWPAARRRRVLRHELAHVARRDFASGFLASACITLLWFHPLAWCLKSALVRTREGACDDLALDGSLRHERDAYVRDLIEIIGTQQRARRHLGMAIALAMGSGRKRAIKRRLAAILDENRDRRAAPKRALWWGTPLLGAAALGIGSLTALPRAGAQVEPQPAGGPVADPVEKSYPLVQSQLDALMPSAAQQDPFARDPFGGPVPAKPQPVDLETAAASARYELVSRFGVPIAVDDEVQIEFESRFKMVVTAPPRIQKSIAQVLDSLMGTKQVRLKLHVFEITDPAWLEKQLGGTAEPASGQLIDQEAFLKLGKAIGESGRSKSMPSVVTRSGQRAKVESIREFIYPTEYDPPEIPVSAKGDPASDVPRNIAVTPANPTAFDVRNVGMTWEAEPIVRADGSIELNTTIEDVQFSGFINYGSAINGIIKDGDIEKSVPLTDNRILQPIFAVSKMSTNFIITPGKVVALTALARRSDKSIIGELEAVEEVREGEPASQPAPQRHSPQALQGRTSYLYIIEAKLVESAR